MHGDLMILSCVCNAPKRNGHSANKLFLLMMSRKTVMRDFIPTWYQVTSQSDVFSIFAGLSSKFFPLFNRTTEEISGF